MSFEQKYKYIGLNLMEKPNKIDKYFIMIYKPNENKKEKKDKMKKFREEIGFLLDDEKEYTEDVIRIFGKYFVEQNKKKYKIIYNNKKYKLKEYFDEIDKYYNPKIKEMKIKLIGINRITNMKEMFYGCVHLTSLSESKNDGAKSSEIFNDYILNSSLFEDIIEMKIKEEYLNNMNIIEELNEKYIDSNDLYNGCTLSSLGQISSIENNFSSNYKKSLNLNFKTQYLQTESSLFFNNIKNISLMFSGCISLISLSDLSKWNTSNVIDMRGMFELCISLKSLPDISQWNTSNVTNMSFMFNECNSLISLPDISNWDISNVVDMSFLFSNCNSLKSPYLIFQNGIPRILMICIVFF